MKKALKLTLITVILAFACSSLSAQKIGVIDINALVMLMPERDEVSTKFTTLQKDKEQTYDMMVTEYGQKFQDYQKNSEGWSESLRAVKGDELNQWQQKIAEYEAAAQEELQQAYQQLMQPVYVKAQGSIEKVAKNGNFDIIIDTGAGVHYYNTSTVTNILDLVKADLGIK